jgi:hypothetical protein
MLATQFVMTGGAHRRAEAMPKSRAKERRRTQRDLKKLLQHHGGRPKPPQVSDGHPRPVPRVTLQPDHGQDPDGAPTFLSRYLEVALKPKEETK